jgi:hypothetical protein
MTGSRTRLLQRTAGGTARGGKVEVQRVALAAVEGRRMAMGLQVVSTPPEPAWKSVGPALASTCRAILERKAGRISTRTVVQRYVHGDVVIASCTLAPRGGGVGRSYVVRAFSRESQK